MGLGEEKEESVLSESWILQIQEQEGETPAFFGDTAGGGLPSCLHGGDTDLEGWLAPSSEQLNCAV